MQANLRLLTHSNLQRLVDAVGVLYEPVRESQLSGHFAAVLSGLIPGEFHGVTTVVSPKNSDQRRHAALYPVPLRWESLAETFASLYPKFPLQPIRESGNLHQPLAISDVESRQKIESLDLYHDYYRVLGVEDDLSVNFGRVGLRVCLAILRAKRGFSDQDRAMLAVLGLHMERANRYSRMLELSRTTAMSRTEPANHALGATDSLEDTDGASRSLCSLGLSEREAEVLYWVAVGKSSPVISTILGIRHDTVRAHLKRIYAKLGVENRLSAALRALEILRSVPSVQE